MNNEIALRNNIGQKEVKDTELEMSVWKNYMLRDSICAVFLRYRLKAMKNRSMVARGKFTY